MILKYRDLFYINKIIIKNNYISLIITNSGKFNILLHIIMNYFNNINIYFYMLRSNYTLYRVLNESYKNNIIFYLLRYFIFFTLALKLRIKNKNYLTNSFFVLNYFNKFKNIFLICYHLFLQKKAVMFIDDDNLRCLTYKQLNIHDDLRNRKFLSFKKLILYKKVFMIFNFTKTNRLYNDILVWCKIKGVYVINFDIKNRKLQLVFLNMLHYLKLLALNSSFYININKFY